MWQFHVVQWKLSQKTSYNFNVISYLCFVSWVAAMLFLHFFIFLFGLFQSSTEQRPPACGRKCFLTEFGKMDGHYLLFIYIKKSNSSLRQQVNVLTGAIRKKIWMCKTEKWRSKKNQCNVIWVGERLHLVGEPSVAQSVQRRVIEGWESST